jgi:hypothetical protein
MQTVIRRLTFAIALSLSFGDVLASPRPPADRTEVPIREVILSDGTRRYTLPITIGATTLEVGLDSGSTGLRVLPGALGESDAKTTGGGDTYSYGSGAKYDGVIGRGALTIGGASGASAIQLIRKIGCTSEQLKCPVSRIPESQYGIQGDGLAGEGFKAILGVNMANAEIANPLVEIGAQRWIIELPRPGEQSSGKLVINPTDDEVEGFAMIPVVKRYASQEGGLHDAVAGCLINNNTKARACGAMLMDTGAPGLRIVNGNLGRTPWTRGPATLVILDGSGKPAAAESLTTNERAHASALSFDENPKLPTTVIYSGLTAYFAFDVLYDPGHGIVGLRPRVQLPTAPIGQLIPRK